MPGASSEELSRRFHSNWFLRCRQFETPKNGDGDDGSLTNLGWLQNLSVVKLTSQLPQATASMGSQEQEHPPIHQNTLELYRQHCLNYGLTSRQIHYSCRERSCQVAPIWRMISTPNREICRPGIKRRPTLSARLKSINKKIQVLESFPNHAGNRQILSIVPVTLFTNRTVNFTLPTVTEISLEEREAFSTNQSLRPPFNYATLICMSMQALEKNKATLDEIYSWIAENFAFYRDSEPTWKLALRQTLIGSPLFQRVPRRKEEPGGWSDRWRLHPNVHFEIPRTASHQNTPTSPSKTRSRSSAIGPKLIIQSKVRPETNQTDDEDDLPPSPTDESPCSYHQGQESIAISDWLTEELPQSVVDRLIGDLDHSCSSDPYPMEEFSTIMDEEEPTRSPMSEVQHSWTDERLNLEELDDILGLN